MHEIRRLKLEKHCNAFKQALHYQELLDSGQADSRGELSPLRGTPAHDFCLPAPPRVGRAGPRRSLVPKFSAFLAEFRQDFGGRSETTWRGMAGVPKNLQAEYVDIPVDQITTRLIDTYMSRRRREGLSGSRPVLSPAQTSPHYWTALPLDHHHDCMYLVVGPDPCSILRTSYEHHRLQ